MRLLIDELKFHLALFTAVVVDEHISVSSVYEQTFAVSGHLTACNAGIERPCPSLEPVFAALQIYER